MSIRSGLRRPRGEGDTARDFRFGVCGKRTYTSAKQAKRAHTAGGWRIKTYWCDACQGWHATNMEKA